MQSEKKADGTWQVTDDSGAILQDGFKNKKAADAAHPELAKAETESDAEMDEDEDGGPKALDGDAAEEKTEWNPFGLNVHQRLTQLFHTLSRAGIKHSESAHPAQNAQTTADKFARKAKDGQNALPAADKQLTPIQAITEDQ